MATLSTADAKWGSPQCEQARLAAANYKDKNLNLATALVMGPYGLALAASTRENSQRRRAELSRNLHVHCSSEPLPKNLEVVGASAAG